LYWGGQKESSWNLYKPIIDHLLKQGHLNQIRKAFSREAEKLYVQDLLKSDEPFIAKSLKEKCYILICGALQMQEGVEEVLEQVTIKNFEKPLMHFKDLGLIRTDCY
ncbi:MAG: nitric oxide synthase, partial [Bacteroidota bacterium]